MSELWPTGTGKSPMNGEALRAGLSDAFRPKVEHGRAAAQDAGYILAEADHRIANHLALLSGFVRLQAAALSRQAEAPSRASMRLLLDGVGVQINAVARLHRILAADGRTAAPRTGSVNLGDHLHEICTGFASGLSGETTIVENFSPDCAVRPDQLLPLSQIVAEVITNALKHARQGREPNSIRVECCEDRQGAVRIEVCDNGPGFPPDFDPETDAGLGFGLIRALGRKLGARTEFQSTSCGLVFRLTLPGPAAQFDADEP